ncbi:unnamed protein product, partial [Mesorhabditis belari]|uniref:Uncharacterized protein n=1 Tax=Mesorhabditis belari TaxID=2138241 RepID=A0AAF3EG55_9BILA
MSDLIQVTIKDLLKQISDRANHGREERMQASLELCRTLERLRNLQELPKGWQELGDDFLVIITARSGPLELKKNLSTCLAALGVLTGWEYELFIQWLLDAIEALHRKAEEERMMLIGAMASSIVVNATKSFPFAEKLSDKLMKFAIKSLEANTSHQVHSSLMELCTAVSQFSPTKFRAFFEDMVDLTVGWLMDETVPKKIHAKCEEALLGLSSFWLERPNYAKELMKQFRRDIVEDLEDLRNGGITGKEAQTVLSRAGSLIKTHAIIMRIYLNAPNEENLRIVIVSTIEELILAGESYISIFRVNDSNPTKLFLALVYVFELISELRAVVEEDFLKLTTSCVTFLFKVIDSFPGAIYLINGYLDLLTKFESNVPHIDEVVNMSTTLIHGQTDVSNYSKIGLIYQFLANPSTIKASSRLISALLSEKNIKTIQATYTMVIKWIGDELASLQAAKNNSNFKEQLEIKNASIRLFCLLQSLEHLATIKNSFVVMMLQPTLFTFLTTLPLSDDTFLEGFPMEHHTLMRLLHLHCESHGFFVVNSSWIVAASPSPIHQNLTKNHAESQLKLLHALLLKGNRVTLGKTRKLCDEWLESLFNNLPDYSLPEVVNHRDFKELQVTLWSLLLENPKRIERLQSVLKILEVTASNDEETMISQVKQARTNVQKLNHEDSIRLWKKIPSRSYILSGVSITGWTDTEMTQKKANECRFSTEHFSIIITFLLHKQMPNLLRNENDTWIHETIAYLHSTITGVEKELLMIRWRWALAQTVNYCVENRMRTQFGGPMETFSEFSKEIHRLAKEAISEIPNNKVEEKTMKSQPSVSSTTTLARRPEKSSKDEGNEVKEPRALNASEDWWRVRLLLEFVDLLDKAIYSAHTGASFSPFNVSEISRHFFIQNANACQEWLSRNYIPAMAVAYTAGAYAQVIRFGASALLDFERKQKKEKAGNNRESPNEADSKMNGQTMPGLVLMALQWITKAMVQLGYELPILGLAGWTQRVYAIVPEWLPICADIAAARWESSIAKLRTYLIQKNSDVEAKFAREMMLFCVLRVRLPELVSANHCPPDLSMWDVMSDSTNDAMFPECPPGFEESAFNCCRDLCVFGKVDTVPVYSNTAWKIPEKSLQIEHTLLTTMRRPEVLDIETQLANDAALVLATEGPLRLHTRFAIVQAIARLLATRMQKKGPELQDVHASIIAELDPAFILEKPKSDLGERVALGRQLLLWTERLGGPAYIESHVQMARLCRKTSNHMLTASHLMRAASNPNYARSSFNQIMVARQGAKMLWPTATFEQRAQHFVGLFSLAAKAYEMDLNQRVNGETFSPTSTRSSEVLLQLPNGNTIPVDPFNASAPVTTAMTIKKKALTSEYAFFKSCVS